MTTETGTPAYEGWAVIEIMGHKKLAGYVREAAQYGTSMLRVDVFGDDDKGPKATQFYGGTAIYCVTPCTEDVARALTKHTVETPEAVRYALPAPRSCETGWRYGTPCSPDMGQDEDDLGSGEGDTICGRHKLQREAEGRERTPEPPTPPVCDCPPDRFEGQAETRRTESGEHHLDTCPLGIPF